MRDEQLLEASQALQDHLEQHHGIALKASEWDAATRATLQAITNAGYAVVPVEPTQAMIEAGCELMCDQGMHAFHGDAEETYKAMIAEAAGRGS